MANSGMISAGRVAEGARFDDKQMHISFFRSRKMAARKKKARPVGRPAKKKSEKFKTPMRSFRCSDATWQAFAAACEARGVTIVAGLHAAMEQWMA